MADEYLLSFLNDAQSLVYGLVSVFEFILGLCYFLGKNLSGIIVNCISFVWELGIDVAELVKLIALEVVELEQYVFRGILLVYYGVGKIGDAFYITFTDLWSFACHMTWSLSQHAQTGFDFILKSILNLAVIPNQLCAALTLIGESFMSGSQQTWDFLTYVFFILVWTPVHAVTFASHLLFELVKIPPKVLVSIPRSAYIGLMVITLVYFVYCRLSFRRLFTSIYRLFQRALGLVRKLVTSLARLFGISKSGNSGNNNNTGPTDLKGICVVCQENPVAYIANPCSHVSLCRDCVHRLVKVDNRCPMCRDVVETFSRVYIS